MIQLPLNVSSNVFLIITIADIGNVLLTVGIKKELNYAVYWNGCWCFKMLNSSAAYKTIWEKLFNIQLSKLII